MAADFESRLRHGPPVLLDGAMGTELTRHGFELPAPLWSAAAIERAPELVLRIHRESLDAGAEVITANTFRTQRRTLSQVQRGAEFESLTRRAVDIARQAQGGRACWIAGSMAPLGDCYTPADQPAHAILREEHVLHAQALAAAGVDLLLVETQLSIAEALIAGAAASATGLPWCLSFVCGRDGALLSGEPLADAAEAVGQLTPAALLVNCVPCDEVPPALRELQRGATGLPVGAYANTGRRLADGVWESTAGVDPAVYAGFGQSWITAGARLIGGCCGTTPEHIRQLRRII